MGTLGIDSCSDLFIIRMLFTFPPKLLEFDGNVTAGK